ncbi:MAG TPA: M48 family metallopeptidase [Bryobacteraceae bacterium]|nr:M48 family metallopeptidase [Bryobacteraceae bacterium]
MIGKLLYVAVLLAIGTAGWGQTPPRRDETNSPSKTEVKTYTLPPDKLERAIELARARVRLHFVSVAYSILVLVGFLVWKIAPGLRTWAEGSRRRIAQAYIFAPLLFLAYDVANLPVSLYDQHLSLKYGQSVQGWGSWFWDWTKGELLQFGVIGLVIWILYGVIRRSPRRWWFYFWLAAVPIVVFLLFISPVAIEPMFFQFEPLAAKQPGLVSEIQKVVARGGLDIPRDRMFEMKASEKLRSLNAYVAGIGASKRVVVWDTTIHAMSTGQILFVFGHEMGHYVLNHVWMGIGMTCLILLVFLWLGYHTMHWALGRWGARWSIRGVEDWASLPVLVLAATVFSFVAEPATNSFGRMLEHNADIYGLEVVHGLVPNSPEVAAQAFQILGEVGLSDPNPSAFVKFWLEDHPAISDRVQFASVYDPWDTGQAPKYVK